MPAQKPILGARPVIILGMHRSGTSCLAGSLQQAGLYLGDVNTKAPHNAKGNRENRAIMDLNDRVLSAAGGSWDDPPDRPLDWSADQIATRDTLIASYPTDRIWGFKEPRTLFTLEGWLRAMPHARLVGTFRHPITVAQSLNTRNGFSIEQGMDLWLAYNRRLLQIAQDRAISMVCFDWAPDQYALALEDLSARLGMTPPSTGFDFFDLTLRHAETPSYAHLPDPVRTVYRDLLWYCSTCKAPQTTG